MSQLENKFTFLNDATFLPLFFNPTAVKTTCTRIILPYIKITELVTWSSHSFCTDLFGRQPSVVKHHFPPVATSGTAAKMLRADCYVEMFWRTTKTFDPS